MSLACNCNCQIFRLTKLRRQKVILIELHLFLRCFREKKKRARKYAEVI